MKGFISFTLVLAMILVLFYFACTAQTSQLGMEKVKNELMKAEQANKERTLLENNTDKIIQTKLKEQMEKKNFNVEQVQNEINTNLAKYLQGKAELTTIFYEKLGVITAQNLNENSNVMIIQGKNVTYGEYTFTSTITRNTTVSTKLGNEITTHFEIPVGYSVKILLPAS
jgi:hypothetical protein